MSEVVIRRIAIDVGKLSRRKKRDASTNQSNNFVVSRKRLKPSTPGSTVYALSRHASRTFLFMRRVDRSNMPQYELVTEKLSWQSAAEYCRDRNSQLVAIANEEEQDALRLYLDDRQARGEQTTSSINPAF